MEQSVEIESLVCKYNQTGYCKYGGQCQKIHNNTLCPNKICRNKYCIKRHPKTCRYFAINLICSLKDKCAYAHYTSNADTKIVELEREIKLIKEEK